MRRKQRLPLPFPTPHVFASQKHPRHTQQTLQHVLHTATQTTTGTKADIGCPGAPLFVSVSVHSASLKEEPTARRLQPATRTTRPRQYLLSNLFTYGIPQPPPPLHNTASVRASQRMADPRSPFPGLPGRVVALLLAAITGLLLGGDHVQAAFVKPLGAGAAAVSKWLALFLGPFLLSLPLSISFDFPLSFSDPPPPPALSCFPISLTHSRAAASACRLRPKPSRARV